MVRFRILGLALMALFAVGAVASASASATPLCEMTEEGGDYAVCIEPGTEYEGVLVNDKTAVNSELKGKVLGFTTVLKGATAKAEITAEDSGKSKGTIEFTNITVIEPPNCTVKEPVIANFTDELSIPPAAITDTFTGSGAGEVFTEITFEGAACALGGKTFKVTGKQHCEFDTGITTFQANHNVICKFTGSELFLGENKAKFEATFEEVEPITEANWSIRES